MKTRTTTMMTAGLSVILLAGAARASSPPLSLPDLKRPVVQITQGGTAICGHVGELLAARSALEVGDRAGALAHLKEARRLLTTCEDRLAGDEGKSAENAL